MSAGWVVANFIMADGGKQTLPPTKCRRLCEQCNQLLAKTTYWGHQRLYFGISVPHDDSVSDFELKNAMDTGVSEDNDSNKWNGLFIYYFIKAYFPLWHFA